MATQCEKLKDWIFVRFQLRVYGSLNHKQAILVSDVKRTVYVLDIAGLPHRATWYQAIVDQLADGVQPKPMPGADYHFYAR